MKEHESLKINTSERIPQTDAAQKYEMRGSSRKSHEGEQSLRHLVEGTRHLYKDAERILLDN